MNSTLVERGPRDFTDGPVTLLIGRDAAVTQWEILGHMSADRLSLDSLTRGLTLLELEGDFPDASVASVFVDDKGTAGPVKFSPEPPEIPAKRVLIAEAMASAWRSRIQDISDASTPLSQDAVEDFGRLDISGQPYLNELVAQRRRDPHAENGEVATLADLVHDLRQSVVFGAAGFVAADPDTLIDTTQKALAPDGWMHKLSLLIAAEECLAAVLLHQIRTTAPTPEAATELAGVCNLILKNRTEDFTLIQLLQETLVRLNDPALRDANRVKKIWKKSSIKMFDGAVYIIRPFVVLRRKNDDATTPRELMSGTAPSDSDAPLQQEIYDAELIEDFNPEELATAFGELFEKMLPEAEGYADKLRKDHPEDTRQQREERAARRFLDLASGNTVDTRHGYLALDEAVALHAMTLAVLREIPVNDPDKRARQAKRLRAAIMGFDTLQGMPDNQVVQQVVSTAQQAVIAFVLGKTGPGMKFPRLAVVMNFVPNFIPRVDNRLVAEKVLGVVNLGALKVIATMVDKAIR